jgi:hypothetical protein
VSIFHFSWERAPCRSGTGPLKAEKGSSCTRRGSPPAALVLLFFLLRGLFGRNQEDERARPEPVPSALPTVEPPVPVPTTTPEEIARDLRNDAIRECGAGEWMRCMEDLERAGYDDPAGNRDPKIQELLRNARKHLPDPKLRPPKPQ